METNGTNGAPSPGSTDDGLSEQAHTDENRRISPATAVQASDNDKQEDTANLETTEGDDDDNWSRQVETDDLNRVSSSVLDEADDRPSVSVARSTPQANPEAELTPQRQEPTLKEKMVERERQRRVETERGRLKRHFALHSTSNQEQVRPEEDGEEYPLNSATRENGSVAGTVGEGSIVAPVDGLVEDDSDKQLTYAMARFLQEQENTLVSGVSVPATIHEAGSKREAGKNTVVMERFLQDPVVVDPSEAEVAGSRSNVDRSVSFDVEPQDDGIAPAADEDVPSPRSLSEHVHIPPESVGSFIGSTGEENEASVDVTASVGGGMSFANASMICVTSEDSEIADLPEAPSETSQAGRPRTLRADSLMSVEEGASMAADSLSLEQPRLLGLTEGEIREMAAIDDVSQQNAPPSERDDLSASSFVGELVSELGDAIADPAGTLSQGTPTTVMESASMVSGNQSAPATAWDQGEDQQSVGAICSGSMTSNQAPSSTGGSVLANPPSDIGADETPLSPPAIETHRVQLPPTALDDLQLPRDESNAVARAPTSQGQDVNESPLDSQDFKIANAGVLNRKIRPGMINLHHRTRPTQQETPTSPVRRVMSVPDMHFDLDGFDYDKNAPLSPGSGLSPSIKDLPASDMWSPGSRLTMEQSPFRPQILNVVNATSTHAYGATSNDPTRQEVPPAQTSQTALDESAPLLPNIPHEIMAPGQKLSAKACHPADPQDDHTSQFGNPLKNMRAENGNLLPTGEVNAVAYMEKSTWFRAFPGRMLMLISTLVIEIPVLLMILGGSGRLCALVGRSNFYLLMGLLPLASAVSGNVGVQASSSTTNAVKFGHVSSQNYVQWLIKEIGVAMCLGLMTGVLLGVVAFAVSYCGLIAFAVAFAQFTSVVLAGFTGTTMPLVSYLVFQREAGKWNDILENAVQDMVGSFTMVILTYKILYMLGPLEVDGFDVCGDVDF